jgi:iron complex outermembrane receptor protein
MAANNRTCVDLLTSVGLGALFATAFAGPALAQTAPDSANDAIVVTGTSIRGTAPIGAAPTIYGRQDLQTNTPVDVAGALSNIPQMTNFGTDQQASTTNRFRTAGYIPVIHNMEIGSTLTLMNGHRMAAVGSEAVFSDPDVLPTIALDRVEVVADGNSAVYGSDAVAGVVNFQYRRNLQGFEADVSTTQDPNTSFENRRISLAWGNRGDKTDIMVAYEHAEHTAPFQKEFPFSATGIHNIDGTDRDRRGTTCIEPLINFGATAYSGPARTAGTARCDPNLEFNTGAPNSKRDSALSTIRYRPVEGIELTAELNYSKYAENSKGTYANIDITVPSSSPFFVVPPGANPAGITSERVRETAVGPFGYRYAGSDYDFWGATLGSTFDLPANWQTDLRLHYSQSTTLSGSTSIDAIRMQQLATAGTFNPFGANTQAAIDGVLNGYRLYNFGRQSLTEFEAKADGPLFSLPGGDVKMAVGFNHRTETLRQIQDQGCLSGCSFYVRQRDDDDARGVNALFTEVSVPVFSSENAIPAFKELTLSIAGRYDKYDLLKPVFTPKVGFVWRPVDMLSLHASAGRSFAAPNIGYLTGTFGIIQAGTNIGGITFDIYNMGGGNPALTPERAKTFSYGADFKPDFLPGFSAGASYYNVAYENLVYKPSRDDAVFNPAFASARIVGDPSRPTTPVVISQALINEVIAQAPPDRPLGTQTFTLVHRSYAINLGRRLFAGIDLNARYEFDTGFGNFNVAVNANRQAIRKTQVVPGTAFSSEIGSRTAPEWQTHYQAQWTAPSIPLRLGWEGNYMSSYNDRFGSGCCDIPSNFIQNATAAYDFKNILGGTTLQFRVTNIADRDPPLYDAVTGFDGQNASPYGRQFTVTLRTKF